jgi:hypothetical protein
MADAEKTSRVELSPQALAQDIRQSLRRPETRSELFDAIRAISLVPRRWEPTPNDGGPEQGNLFNHEWGDEYCLHDDLKLEAARKLFQMGLEDEAAEQLADLAPSTYQKHPQVIARAVEGNPSATARVLARTVAISQRSVSPKLPES